MSDLTKRDVYILRTIIQETLWMARRYADGRCTYAPSTVNEAIDAALALGLHITTDADGTMYAKDGQLGQWKDGRFVK